MWMPQLLTCLQGADDLVGRAVRQELAPNHARQLRLSLMAVCLAGLVGAVLLPTSAAVFLIFPLLVTSFFEGTLAGMAFVPLAMLAFGQGSVAKFDLALMAALCAFCVLISGVTSHKYRELFAHRQRLLNRLEIAREVQRGLEPPPCLAIGSLTVSTRMEVCNELGGDFVGLSRLEGGDVVMIMGDVQGKGPQSALTAAYLQGVFHDCSHSGMSQPAEILGRLHALIAGKDEGRFVTAICLRYSAQGGRFEIANAGHPRPILFGSKNSRMIGASGVVLGISGVFELGVEQIELKAGERLLLMSDGCYEEEEITPSLAGLLAASRLELCQVFGWIKESAGELSDDRTVVLLQHGTTANCAQPD